ncbi:MAG: hypothetical protein R2834_04095 [Rhodothermales bacterium]
MNKTFSLGTVLLIALVAVVAALLAYRAWFGPSAEGIDRENRELMIRLERSQRTRDSLQTIVASLNTELTGLQRREGQLVASLDSLDTTLADRNTRIRILQRNLTRYDLPPDSLVRDLNAILARLYADSSAGAP